MTSIRRPLRPTHLAALALLLGCNALTGADDIVIGEGDESEGGGAASGSGASTGQGGAGTGAEGTGAVGNGTGVGGETQQQPLGDALGLSIQEIAIYQGVKRPLMQSGAPAQSGVPVVANRDALVRVFASSDGTYNNQPVTARFIVEGQAPIEVVQPVAATAVESNLGSTINFDVPAAFITPGANYRVELKQPSTSGSPAVNPAATFPQGGFTPIGAQSSGSTLKIVLVPITYTADGSNRTPDTSPGQLAAYEASFYAIYPVADITLTVHSAVSYNGTITAGGSGWENLLSAVADLRADENAPSDTYYYGIFSPAPTLGQFCGGGCVSGLGFVGGPNDSYQRAAIGLGFTGSNSIETAIHEVGHNHGRSHAPCGGPSGQDQSFPYGGGSIGSWGYDLTSGQLKPPQQHADFMGYCDPTWISDYTFTAVFNRIKSVNGAKLYFDPALMDQTWERVLIGVDGPAFLEPIELHEPPLGQKRTITAQTTAGPVELEGHFAAFDHTDGGLLFWKKPELAAVSAISVQHAGAMLSVARPQ